VTIRLAVLLAAVMLPLGAGAASGQDMGSFDQPLKARQYVTYVAESQVVAAKRPAQLELRFHVKDGFHVNSHTPSSELLIATGLSLQTATGVIVGEAQFPAGTAYQVGSDTLDVYTGDFTVRLPVTAAPGDHAIDGELKYQACDRAACYPAKTLRVKVLFTAR
jgi:DsbC/DsbD-like thiol-disulfide interchange protein